MTTAFATSVTERGDRRHGAPARTAAVPAARAAQVLPGRGALIAVLIASLWPVRAAAQAPIPPPPPNSPPPDSQPAPEPPAPKPPAPAPPSGPPAAPPSAPKDSSPAPAPAEPASPAAAPQALATGTPLSPVELRDRMEKVGKQLRKAADAVHGKDLQRASFLLQRVDEELTRFEAGSNIGRYLAALDEARQSAEAGSLPAAASALRSARGALPSIADYTVSRSMEISYRAALQGADSGSAEAFGKGLVQMDEATMAVPLAAGCRQIREALGRARKAIGRNDTGGGGKEVDAALAALTRMDYGGQLTRARSGLYLASELLRDGALLAARDQTQKGLKELADAIEAAPAADKDALASVQEDARAVWRRMGRPEKEDPDRLSAASDQVETLRRALRS